MAALMLPLPPLPPLPLLPVQRVAEVASQLMLHRSLLGRTCSQEPGQLVAS